MTLHIGWPQAIYLVLVLACLGLTAKDHGKPRSPESFWTQLAATVIVLPLLFWGGFFR